MSRIRAAWYAFRNPARVEVRDNAIHIYGPQRITQSEAKVIRYAVDNDYTANLKITLTGADIERVLLQHRRGKGQR